MVRTLRGNLLRWNLENLENENPKTAKIKFVIKFEDDKVSSKTQKGLRD